MKNKITIISLLLIAVVAIGYYFLFNSGSTTDKVEFSIIKNNFSEDDIRGEIRAINNEDEEAIFDVIFIPHHGKRKDQTIYFYHDSKYPVISTSLGSSIGVYDHLQSELQQKLPDQQIEIIDSDELVGILEGEPSLVIVPTGVIPNTVYDKKKNLITPFVRSGGRMIWIGDVFGYYYGIKNTTITSDNYAGKIGWSGQREIFSQNLLEGVYNGVVGDTIGDNQSSIAEALDIRYSITQTGSIIDLLNDVKGNDFGWSKEYMGSERTSLSNIPIGKGSILLFGSGVLNREVDIAWDISQVLLIDGFHADLDSISTKTFSVAANQDSSQDFTIINDNFESLGILILKRTEPKIFYYYATILK